MRKPPHKEIQQNLHTSANNNTSYTSKFTGSRKVISAMPKASKQHDHCIGQSIQYETLVSTVITIMH
jgi:hypothetical protein